MATSTSYKLPACRYPKLRQPNQPPTIQTHTHTPPAGHASNLIWLRTCCSCCSPLLRFPEKPIENSPAACAATVCVCMYICVLHRVGECISHLTYFRDSESLSSISGTCFSGQVRGQLQFQLHLESNWTCNSFMTAARIIYPLQK